jgi:hypothetical protein
LPSKKHPLPPGGIPLCGSKLVGDCPKEHCRRYATVFGKLVMIVAQGYQVVRIRALLEVLCKRYDMMYTVGRHEVDRLAAEPETADDTQTFVTVEDISSD